MHVSAKSKYIYILQGSLEAKEIKKKSNKMEAFSLFF